MRAVSILILAVPGLVQAQGAGTEAQAVMSGTRARLASFHKEIAAWLGAGKPFEEFPGSLAKDIANYRATLARTKKPEVRHALLIAIATLEMETPNPRTKAPEPDLQGIPPLSPAWSLNPSLLFSALKGMKDPAAARAFLEEAEDHHPDPSVRKELLHLDCVKALGGQEEAVWKQALAKLEQRFPDTKETKDARKKVRESTLVTIGSPAPPFTLASLDEPGRSFTLDTFKGKYLLLDFWATWCGPCAGMVPTLRKLNAEYQSRGLEVLSIADDRGPEVVQAFRKKAGMAMPWKHVVNTFDAKARRNVYPVFDDYGIGELPSLVLIGPDGKVLAKGEQLHEHLADVLAKFIPAGPDLGPLKLDMANALAAVKAAREAHETSGKDMATFAVDEEKVLAPIRARAKAARGEQLNACLVAELNLRVKMGLATDGIAARIFREVPPESASWELGARFVNIFGDCCGEAGKDYLARLKERGIPEVRVQIRVREVFDRLFSGDVIQAKVLTDQLTKEFPGDKMVQTAVDQVASELKTPLGETAPAFQVRTLERADKNWTLGDFKGKYLLMDFWGTWCGWCVSELPETHKAYEKFKGRGLEILSLALDAKPELVVEFRKKPNLSMPWKHGFLGRDKEHPHPMLDAYGVMGFPTLFLVGPDGKILAKSPDLRGEILEKTLEKFLPAAP